MLLQAKYRHRVRLGRVIKEIQHGQDRAWGYYGSFHPEPARYPHECVRAGCLLSLRRQEFMVIAELPSFTADSPVVSWGRLLFSAKEAVIKAWYPLTGRLLDFTEIVITLRWWCVRCASAGAWPSSGWP